MNLNIKRKIIKNKLFLLSSFLVSLISFSTYSGATNKVSTYYLGSESELNGFIDKELPPAIKANVALDSSIPAGTILYRQQYLNVTYYSPVPHPSIKGTQYENSNKSFREWGPWDMDLNRTAYKEGDAYALHFIPSSYKYDTVTLKKGATVQVPYVNSSGKDVVGTYGKVSQDTTVRVKSITNYSAGSGLCVYFDISGVPITRSSTYTPAVNIGRVSITSSTVTNKNGYKQIFKSDAGSNQSSFDNFSLYGQYKDTTDASHENVEPGKWTNPSYADYGMAGVSGEWKCLGFNSKGEPLYNPYHPSKSLMFRGNAPLAEYDFRYTPWNGSDSVSGESEFDKADAYETFPGKTTYDIDSSGKYNADKRKVIERLFNSGKLKRKKSTLAEDVTDMINRTSFITHPSRESVVMLVQRKSGVATRKFMVENSMNDIYLHSMIIKDSNGAQIGSYSYDINTGKSSMSEAWVKAGQKYRVEVYLANANSNTLVATKNHAQIGLVNNHVAVMSMPYGSTFGNQNGESSGRMGATKGSKSSAIVFNITAPSESDNVDFFDVYGYVGYKHSGADNMNFTNDVGYVRLNINGTNYGEETQYSYGDLYPEKIDLLDASGNVVYSLTNGKEYPDVYKFLPLNTYSARVTITNIGDDVAYRTKSRGHWEGDNWIPGTWSNWIPMPQDIAIMFQYGRMGSEVSSSTVNSVPREYIHDTGTGMVATNEIITSGEKFYYTINNIFIEDAYFFCGFNPMSTGFGDWNTENNYFQAIIGPNFDAEISNVRIKPSVEYINNEQRLITYIVTYDAYLYAPDYMKGKAHMAIDTSINVGGKVSINKDILSVGENNNISHIIKDVPISSSGRVTATVILNYNRHAYETNNDASNNIAIGTATVNKIGNPFNTTVCPVRKTSSSWTPNQDKYTWSATVGGYSTAGNAYRKYNRYSITKETNKSVTHNESFEITNIEFRSKYTKDKKLGDNGDGWIKMLDNTQKNNAYIRAGYGFELRVTTTYTTNVNTVAFKNYLHSNSLSGVNYSYLTASDRHNLLNELFIELPGSSSKRKILSTTGYSGTINGLKVETNEYIKDNKKIIENKYTLNSVNSLGISNSNKIFIPETMKDGDYTISIYTPEITGTPSAREDSKSAVSMCDRRNITIKIDGSYLDDLNSHHTSIN